MLRTLLAFSFLVCTAPGFAKEVAGQGKACSAKDKCDAGMTCVRAGDGKSTCQIPCSEKTKCPEDQRCVKDAGHRICRPINDADL